MVRNNQTEITIGWHLYIDFKKREFRLTTDKNKPITFVVDEETSEVEFFELCKYDLQPLPPGYQSKPSLLKILSLPDGLEWKSRVKISGNESLSVIRRKPNSS